MAIWCKDHTTVRLLFKLLTRLEVVTRTRAVSLGASPTDGHPEHGRGHGKQTDPHQGRHSAPAGSLWVIPPALHTSLLRSSNDQEARERKRARKRETD